MKRFASQALHMGLCYLCLQVLENGGFLASICPILMPVSPLLNILVKRGQALQYFIKCLSIMWEEKLDVHPKKKRGTTQAMERQICRNSLLKPYLSGLSGDSLFYENEVMSVLSLQSQMIQFERHRLKQEVILKQYIEKHQLKN